MPRILRLLLCLAALALSLDAYAARKQPVPSAPPVAQPPSRIEASYNVLKDGMKAATITEIFTRDKNGYHIESISKASGLVALLKPEIITITSNGAITPQGLHPQAFTNQRKLDKERNTRADFDWETKQITLDDRSGKRTVALPPGTQDRLSAMYQFMYAPLKNASTYDFYMTNGSKVDIYNYLVTPNRSVTVPLGTFKSLYVSTPSKAGESRTEIWLATERWNFPYKMVITDEGGDKLIQELTHFNFVP